MMNTLSSNQFAWAKPLIVPFIAVGTGALANCLVSYCTEKSSNVKKKSNTQKNVEKIVTVAGIVLGAIVGYALYKNGANSAKLINEQKFLLEQLANKNKEATASIRLKDCLIDSLNATAREQIPLRFKAERNNVELNTKLTNLLSTLDKAKAVFVKLGLITSNTISEIITENSHKLDVTSELSEFVKSIFKVYNYNNNNTADMFDFQMLMPLN